MRRTKKREYKGYYFEKCRGGWDIFTDLQEKELPGHRAYAGRAPTLASARELVDNFYLEKAVPWYESKTRDTVEELAGEGLGLTNLLLGTRGR